MCHGQDMEYGRSRNPELLTMAHMGIKPGKGNNMVYFLVVQHCYGKSPVLTGILWMEAIIHHLVYN